MASTLLGVKPGTLEGLEEVADRTLRRTYRRTYWVQADSDDDREPSILLCPGLPQIKEPFVGGHDSDDTALCSRRVPRHVDKTKRLWEVDIEYSTDETDDEEDDEEDPIDLPVEVEWDFETIEEVCVNDVETGLPITTSAGEKFADPPVTRPRAIPILTCSRYELTFTAATILAYVNKVNDAEFLGFTEKQALCAGIRARKVSIKGRRLWHVTYTFKFNTAESQYAKGWQLELLDNGSYFLFADEVVTFEDLNGNPRMGNLDGSGGQADQGEEEFVIADVFETADFSALNLE